MNTDNDFACSSKHLTLTKASFSTTFLFATLALVGCSESKNEGSKSNPSAKAVEAKAQPFSGRLTHAIAAAVSKDEYMSWSFQPWEDSISKIKARLGEPTGTGDKGVLLWAGAEDDSSTCIVYEAENKDGQAWVSRMDGLSETFPLQKKELCLSAANTTASSPNSKAVPESPAPGEKTDKQAPKSPNTGHPSEAIDLNSVVYDLPLMGEQVGEFEASFALIKRGNAQTGQGSMTIFGPEFTKGDKGVAKDWADKCSTRLNAFSPRVSGFFIYLNKLEPWPTPATPVSVGNSFQFQAKGKKLSYSAFKDVELSSDIRILAQPKEGDTTSEVEVLIDIRQPGKEGSVRGRVMAIVCPAS